jgi:excisionase family DNA binding protein
MNSSKMKNQLLTIDEAARYLNVSKTSLRRWTNEGRLACVRVGPRAERRFRVEDIQRFVDPVTQEGHVARPDGEDPVRAVETAAAQQVPRHISTHYTDRDELWRLFRPYVLDHLARGVQLLYIHEDGARDDVRARLRAEGLDPDELKARGLLRLLVPSQAYLRTGGFSGPRMIDFLEAAILDRRALGHTSMLISGEMTWYLTGADGVQGMIPYEMALNDLLRRYPDVTIVCHYDVNRLPGAITLGAICSHPHVHMPDRFVGGFFRF